MGLGCRSNEPVSPAAAKSDQDETVLAENRNSSDIKQPEQNEKLTHEQLLANQGYEYKEILGKHTRESIESLIRESKSIPEPGGRIAFFAEKFLGAKYQGFTLGGGPDIQEIFVVNLDGMDCMTSIEYYLAMAYASDFDDFLGKLRSIRWEADGRVISYHARNHYAVDWIDENREYIEDVTDAFQYHKSVTRKLDVLEPGYRRKSSGVTRDYIPSNDVARVAGSLKDGDIIFIADKNDHAGVLVRHMATVKMSNGMPDIIHASSASGRVIRESLTGYLNNHNFALGIIVARAITGQSE